MMVRKAETVVVKPITAPVRRCLPRLARLELPLMPAEAIWIPETMIITKRMMPARGKRKVRAREMKSPIVIPPPEPHSVLPLW